MKRTVITFLCCIALSTAFAQETLWFPIVPDQPTPWFREVNPDDAHRYYPRPSMKRDQWLSLNGKWQFTITDKYTVRPAKYDKQILVPFPVESGLSGVKATVNEQYVLWYKRKFFLPESWSQRFILLNIDASDWETKVFVNGQEVGLHRGGYNRFQFDITQYLNISGAQEIEIAVFDPTENGYQPHGGQSVLSALQGQGAASGIWQSVWLEPVLWESFKEVRFEADTSGEVTVYQDFFNMPQRDSIQYVVRSGKKTVVDTMLICSDKATILIDDPEWWSPESPHLYRAELSIIRDGLVLEKIDTYFGIRHLSVVKNESGRKIFYLNDEPYFINGVIDKGYWPDGGYLAPTKEGWVHDINEAKKMGYNAIKKSQKIEPEMWYYLCDSLGLMVVQEVPSKPIPEDEKEAFKTLAQYKIELKKIVEQYQKHVCIYQWNPFPENSEQETIMEVQEVLAEANNNGLIGISSQNAGHEDIPVASYNYIGGSIQPPGTRVQVWTAGGYGSIFLVVPMEKNEYKPDKKELKSYQDRQEDLQENVKALNRKGLAAAFYDQLIDGKHEKSGLITFDRRFNKVLD